MKKTCLCFIIIAFLFFSRTSFCDGAATRILFIGNSLTFSNDLPGMLAQMARSKHHKMDHDMYAPGGYTLRQHSEDANAMKKIAGGKWDFVVLQEQSQLPEFSPEQVERDVFPYAKALCAAIRTANPNAHIVFYMTMAKINGDTAYSAELPEIATYSGMQRRINKSYFTMAMDNNAMTAPVGAAWAIVRDERPDIGLYADETHPNPTGTYLAACVFYHVIFGQSAVGLSHPSSLDDDTAAYLQETADKVCRDNRWTWDE